ncbi:MAG: pyridoxamine 5'-phosphate oxidase [Pseudomonadota bacterium]
MTNRDGIFAGDDPFAIARAWLDEARETEIADPDAVALASVDASGMPNVRVVLMRGLEDDAFVFYTNYESAKGRELDGAGKAAFVLHWKSLKRQIRVRGLVSREDGATADAYYAARPLGSRVGAWASEQSRPLASRAVLEEAVERETARHGEAPARPPHWGGYRIRPLEMEFWCDGAYRLHDRFRWTRADLDTAWDVQRLYP